MDRTALGKLIDGKASDFEIISDKIWDFAEIRYREHKSAELQCDFLSREGFRVTRSIGGIETAFMGEWGSGFPVIAILGEFDALPNLSQQCDIAERKPIAVGGSGHGCGHNLLGTAGLEAVCAVKHCMQEKGLAGTIRYYGCPAEEGGAGKAFLVREGCFKDVDISLTWHPMVSNALFNSTLANIRVFFHFTGVSAHAAAAPQLGRSALDAVELMSVGVNYLREHIITDARIHYAVTNSGGDAPNIVQAEAEVLYAIRAPKTQQVSEIYERVCDVARGAALMTGTKVDIRTVSAYANFLPNDTLDSVMLENAAEFLPISYTEGELEYARQFQAVGSSPQMDTPISIELDYDKHKSPSASTDAGDVSWVVPSSAIGVCCFAVGSTLHSWTAVAQGKSSIAHKGMHTAAKILASSAIDILEDTSLIKKSKYDFDIIRKGETYHSIIPDDVSAGSF